MHYSGLSGCYCRRGAGYLYRTKSWRCLEPTGNVFVVVVFRIGGLGKLLFLMSLYTNNWDITSFISAEQRPESSDNCVVYAGTKLYYGKRGSFEVGHLSPNLGAF